MMSRTNWILLILLGVQAVLILLLANPWSSGYYREQAGETDQAALFPGFEMEAVSSFRIEKGGKKILLEKGAGPEEEAWYVITPDIRYKADRFLVDSLLNTLPRLKNLDMVSRNPEKASVYELDEEGAIHLSASGSEGRELLRLLVGKNLGALRGTYVKLPGRDEVYLEMENIRRCVDRGDDWIAAWRDKTIFTCDKAELQRIKIQGPEGDAELAFRTPEAGGAEGAWWIVSPKEGPVKDWEGKRMADLLSSLRAQGFAAAGLTADAVGLTEPELRITAFLSTGREIRLGLSKEEEGSRYLQVDDDPTIYKVANYQFYPFLRSPQDLIEEQPAVQDEQNEPGAGKDEEKPGEEKASKDKDEGGGG